MLQEVIGQDASNEVEVWGAYFNLTCGRRADASSKIGARTRRVSCSPPSPPSLALIAAF